MSGLTKCMNWLVLWYGLGMGTPDFSFTLWNCEFLCCQLLPKAIRFLEADFRGINIENCVPISSHSERVQALRRGSSLEAFPLELPLALDQSLTQALFLRSQGHMWSSLGGEVAGSETCGGCLLISPWRLKVYSFLHWWGWGAGKKLLWKYSSTSLQRGGWAGNEKSGPFSCIGILSQPQK